MHVDDFLWSGTDLSDTRIIANICLTFHYDNENVESFQYIDLNIRHSNDGILLNQHRYAAELCQVNITTSRLQRLKDELNSTERNSLQETAGQLNWLATQSRPDVSCDVLELTMFLKNAVVDNLKQAYKVAKMSTHHFLMHPM